MSTKSSYLVASWSEGKPPNVQAITTLRAVPHGCGGYEPVVAHGCAVNEPKDGVDGAGGTSAGDFSADFATFNLAMHVGDDLQAVKINREKLCSELALPAEPVWLEQVHSNKVINIDELAIVKTSTTGVIQADASVTRNKGSVCTVMTADCLPVFFCNQNGCEVAIAHAGWRGLHAGIISNTVKAMRSSADEILVSLGPAIGPQAFEVGDEVFAAFVAKNSINNLAFVATTKGRYLCDIYQLARIELQALGIRNIAGGDFCTYRENQHFYSFRRQQKTGRMASLIWFD